MDHTNSMQFKFIMTPDLSVQCKDQSQHSVGSGMLRAKVQGNILDNLFPHHSFF
jgi:hypothetical protein